jgi:hypothetical protein
MIDTIVREYGVTRKVAQTAVLRWMLKAGKFKHQERSTHRKRLNRHHARRHDDLVRALMGTLNLPHFLSAQLMDRG